MYALTALGVARRSVLFQEVWGGAKAPPGASMKGPGPPPEGEGLTT